MQSIYGMIIKRLISVSTAVGSGPLRALRRRHEARREIFTTPRLVTARRSILGPPAEGRPGPSFIKIWAPIGYLFLCLRVPISFTHSAVEPAALASTYSRFVICFSGF